MPKQAPACVLPGNCHFKPRIQIRGLLPVLFIFLIHLFLVTTPLQAETCLVCDNEITGRYLIYQRDGESLTICENCKKTKPACAACRLPTGDGETLAGKLFCSTCAEEMRKRPVCGICENLILEGSATTYPDLDLVICAACQRKSRPCQTCRIPLGRPGDDNSHCAACQQRLISAPHCLHCNRALLESHTVYRSKDDNEYPICNACQRLYPPCNLCGIPAKHTVRLDNRLVCEECQANLDLCQRCQRPVVMMTSFMLSQGVFCRSCVARNPGCDSCGAPVPKGEPALPDGRMICPECRADAITRIDDVISLFKPIRQLIEKSLSMPVREIQEIRFADRQEMLALTVNMPAEARRRLEDAPAGLFERQGELWRIHVLPWQRRDILSGVLAHEFSHALFADYFPDNDRLEEIEGFCEWIRWKVMKKLGDEAGQKVLEKRTDFYGRSFQLIRSIEEESGPRGVFEWIGRFEEDPVPGRFGR